MNLLGVDIGGTKIAVGVVEAETGKVLYAERTPTNAQEGGPAILTRALAHAQHVVTIANVPLGAVGIGAGGQIDYKTGVVLSATDILPGWAGTRLADSFAETFSVPAWADNDVNAFALGEYQFGAGQGASDVIFLALGTGVGGAIFTNGTLHRGKRGTGGELGHMLLANMESEAYDTFESRTKGDRLVQQYRFYVAASSPYGPTGQTHLPEPVTGAAVGEVAKRNPQSDAGDAVRALGADLGVGLASLANVLDTERFVIGGGLAELGDLLLEPARKTFSQYALSLYQDAVIVPAALGKNSSIIGAACVALAGIERDAIV